MKKAQSLPSFTPSANEILADQISELAAHIHAATYRFLVMVREYDERKAWAEMGARSCAHWLNWRCGLNVHTAREKIRVAHALVALENISAAFERGELSYSKVRVVTRIATPENEDTLLNIALSGTAAQLEKVVRCQIRHERECDVTEKAEVAHENREFSWRTEGDGSVVFFGRLPAEMAELVIKAIEASVKTVTAEYAAPSCAASDVEGVPAEPSDPSLPACASVDSQASSQCTSQEPSPKPSLKARRADALVALCHQHCEGYEVTLHVPAGTSLHDNSVEQAGTIPMEATKRICCDAAIVPVIEDEQGNVLDIGRRTRKIPPAMRRALEIRDNGCCRFPGCTSTRFLKGHHIEHWAQGGKTCLDNLVLLCWHHHHLVHEGGFSCRAVRRKNGTAGGNDRGINIVFGSPGGVIIPDAFRLSPADGALENHQAHLGIDEETCMARDCNRSLDVDVVIDALDTARTIAISQIVEIRISIAPVFATTEILYY